MACLDAIHGNEWSIAEQLFQAAFYVVRGQYAHAQRRTPILEVMFIVA